MDKVGEAIKTVRKRYQLKARQVYSGLLSQSAYQRLENGIREIKPHILEAVLSRLGIVCGYVEMLISDRDFRIYCMEEGYKDCMVNGDYAGAEKIKDKFAENYASQDSVLRQRAYRMEAELVLEKEKDYQKALELYKQAFCCTVSFDVLKENDMQLFSKEELKLSIKIAELLMETGKTKEAEQYLWKVKSYMAIFPKKSDKADEEVKLYCYLAKILFERKEYQETFNYIEKAGALLAGMKGFTVQGDLFFYRASILEVLYQDGEEWQEKGKEALRDFMTAYYVYEFQKNTQKCNWIRDHVREKYEWQNI